MAPSHLRSLPSSCVCTVFLTGASVAHHPRVGLRTTSGEDDSEWLEVLRSPELIRKGTTHHVLQVYQCGHIPKYRSLNTVQSRGEHLNTNKPTFKTREPCPVRCYQ